jgi:hypothetical protein
MVAECYYIAIGWQASGTVSCSRPASKSESERGNKMASKLTIEQKRDFCQLRVYIDGHPARISGALNDFATVQAIGRGIRVEFSWAAVARIVAAGGWFSSDFE